MTMRKTKIVATIGPSSKSREMLCRLIDAGVDVVRLNFSHGSSQAHMETAQMVREISRASRCSIGILCDLQGPKIRIGKFEHDQISVKAGDHFTLDAECEMGDQTRVGLDYKSLPDEVGIGDVLLLDDGRIVLEVEQVRLRRIECLVVNGGMLSNNKGINRQGGGLAAAALTEKDKEDIKTAAALGADFVAISFPKNAADIELARALVRAAGSEAHIVAKIERAEAIDHLEEIIAVADVVMVARGDLGVEVGDAAVPGLQKRMIRLAKVHNKAVITATQMMESMISSPIPTRAEVSDVANAVLDGTDAIMLSAETAAGRYPLETVAAVDRVCKQAEKEYFTRPMQHRAQAMFEQVDQSIAMAAVFTAQRFKIKAIAALTQSGSIAKWVSRADTTVPVFALSPLSGTRRKLKLYRNVYPCHLGTESKDTAEVLAYTEDELLRQGSVVKGDMILVTIGEPIGQAGSTNAMKIITIGDPY